jgi:uncharacterized protein YydD (DUF2326 family)
MYLKELVISSNTGIEIRKVSFKKGLNLVVGRKDEQGSSNNLGKTTLMRCINFCLGGKFTEFFEDDETKSINNTVRDFILQNEVCFKLSFVSDFNLVSVRDFTVTREVVLQQTRRSNYKITNSINNEKFKNEKQFMHELKIRLFKNDIDKPTFRQLIPKFVRRNDGQISNILKFLYMASANEYELVHFFLFGFNLPEILSVKNKLHLELKNAIRNLQSLNSIIPDGMEQRLSLLRLNVEEKENLRRDFKINEKYEQDNNQLGNVQIKIDEIKDAIQERQMDNRTLIERLQTLQSSDFSEDTKTIEYMYKEAGLLGLNLQEKFEQTVNFHKIMIDNEVRYLDERIERVNKEIEDYQVVYKSLVDEYNTVLERLGKMGSLKEYTQLTEEIEKDKELISSIETQLNQLNTAHARKDKLEQEIQKISLMLDESINLFKEKIEIFNTYFSKSSNDIYGEKWFVTFTPNEDNTLFKFNVDSLNQNVGSGKKQMLVASFDIAYMAYIQDKRIGLPYPRFATQDKIEIIDITYLEKLFDLVVKANGQLILPIIEDKYSSFSNKDIKDSVILELNQNNKFFNIENY